ncbi:uncharacterized protein [Epargyreus clarus]|uniref:uncharacterized protein isoform X1 n=1 Tax=Epargyreus clarus TaxID=520877 RepID=UPI003C30B39F
MMVEGTSAEQLLEVDAFTRCCKDAASNGNKKDKALHFGPSVMTPKPPTEIAYSLCEDFAPNELCAHHCIPVPGSYRCECNPGFMLMTDGRSCIEITKNRCKPHNPCQHKCKDNGVEVKCSCRRGYQLMADGKSCEDIDECHNDPPVCMAHTQCQNVHGSYKCIPLKNHKTDMEKGHCPPGFSKNLKNNACDDVNECNLPNPPCPYYICENTIGGYKCDGVSGDPTNLVNKPRPPVEDRCPPGFKSNMNEECEDVDECAIGKDDCNKISQFCINTRGSFYCQDQVSKHCPPGFKTNPSTNKCEDIDECEDAEDICRSDQICVNVPGEYDCKPKSLKPTKPNKNECPDGMRKDSKSGICEDVDECVEGTHMCDKHQECVNTNGSHECRCKVGFELDPTTGACTDINECATDQNDCIPESQRCDNTVGSYLCIRFISCGTGYILHHSSSTCEDVNECLLGTHNCDRAGPEYQCVNIPGSFRCQKKPKVTSTPVYEDDNVYYDSEEDIEDNKTISQAGKAETVTTTTATPETTAEVPITEPKRIDETPVHNDIDNNVIDTYNKPEPAFQPNTVPDYIIPQVPRVPIIPYEPPIHEPETTYSPITEANTGATSPKFIFLNVSDETATVKGEKTNDGSVFVDTQDIPKNKWTKIAEVPNCDRGFELGFFGECNDIDECATNLHVCSTVTEVCRNTMGGYVCDCATGFRRDLSNGNCVFNSIVTRRTTTSTSTTTSTTTTTEAPTPAPTTPPTPPPPPPTLPPTPPPTLPPTPPPTLPPTPPPTPPPTLPPTPPPTLPPTPPPTLPPTPPPTPPPTMPPTQPPTTPPPPPTTPPPPPTTPPPPPPTTPPTPPPTSPPRNPLWKNPFWLLPNRPFRGRNTCDVGYHMNVNTGVCEDVNECTNGQANCASVEICVNTDGGYRCDCPPNWRLDPTRHRCVPVRNDGRFPTGYGNEPSYPPVDPNEIFGHGTKGHKFIPLDVTEQERGIVVKCPWGYELGEDNTCVDINECTTGEAKCGPIQVCTNLPGGYTCSCPSGYRLIGDHECQDVDECDLEGGMPICSKNADCVNTIGSYHCRCHEGFKSAPVNDKVCVDLDECTEAGSKSLCQQRCNNVWGGYRCSCHRGYRLNPDNSTCSDVDECTEYKSNYLCRGRCLNEPGSYRCTCPAGYRLSVDKKSCIDIDECETGEASCAKGSQYGDSSDVCLNTRGGYRCQRITCPPGYRLESKHRCTKIQTVCSPTDWNCAHQPTTISYNFITFVSNLEIPQPQGAVNLFTMLGPMWPYAKMRFQLKLVEVNAPPSVTKADFTAFSLKQTNNQAVTSLVKSLEGPQSIELEMSMELYNRDMFGGIAVARLYIYVSEYEF